MRPDLPCFAAAQAVAMKGDVAANAGGHAVLAARAARHGAALMLFPELSLTGYEPALAGSLALTAAQWHTDARLAPLRDVAVRDRIVIVAGAPLAVEGGRPQIAALTILPDGAMQVYTKQYLHGGEEQAFGAGQGGSALDIGGTPVALAVCAEITHAAHAAAAAGAGAQLYAASVLVSEQGYAADAGLLQGYARLHGMPVVMANHGGPTGGWASAGRSAVWDEAGQLVVMAPDAGECLLLAQRQGGTWRGSVLRAGD